MTDSIVRLKVDSQEYDQKLRRAAEGLQRYADGCRQVGGTLSVVEDETLAFVRAVGQMDTVSRSATGKLSEMKRTFTELASQYKQLTDEEKQSPFGKALAQSLDQLKTRINDSKGQLDDINKELNGSGGLTSSLDDLAGKFGINIKQLVGWGTAIAAAKGAMDALKDAFFASETNVDEWGRTVAATEGIYQSFLQTINNGNFSGFLSGIQNVIDKAKEAYNAMDELNTRMTIISPERVKLQTRATELKAIIRREGKDSEAGKAAQEALRALEPRLSKSFEKESKLNFNAFRSQVDAKLAEAGIKLNKYSPIYQMLMLSFSNDDLYNEFKKRGKGSVTTEFKNYNNNGTNTTLLGGYSKTVDTRNLEQKLLDLFTDEWRKTYSPYLTASFSAKGAAASTMLSDARYLKEGGGGGGTTKAEVEAVSGSIDEQTKLVQELQKAWRAAADDDSRQKIKAEIEEQQYLLDRMTGKEKFDPTKMRELTDLRGTTAWASSSLFTAGTAPVAPSELTFSDGLQNYMKYVEKLQVDAYKNSAKKKDGMEDSKKVTSGLNEVASGLQQMGIMLPQEVQQVLGVINGLMTVIEGVNTIIGVTQAAELTANTAAMVALTSALWANTATSFIPGFARGGIVPHAANGYYVPGNKYSGDATPIMANAGELILNKAAQGNLVSMLGGGGLQDLNLSAIITGEQIRLVLNNNGRRTGRGEYVTTNFRRYGD